MAPAGPGALELREDVSRNYVIAGSVFIIADSRPLTLQTPRLVSGRTPLAGHRAPWHNDPRPRLVRRGAGGRSGESSDTLRSTEVRVRNPQQPTAVSARRAACEPELRPPPSGLSALPRAAGPETGHAPSHHDIRFDIRLARSKKRSRGISCETIFGITYAFRP